MRMLPNGAMKSIFQDSRRIEVGEMEGKVDGETGAGVVEV